MPKLSSLTTIHVAETMAAYGWDEIWQLSALEACGPIAVRKGRAKPWVAVGVWTGPQQDLLCLKACQSNTEAEMWLSPNAETIEEALQLAVRHYAKLKRLMPKSALEWETAMELKLS